MTVAAMAKKRLVHARKEGAKPLGRPKMRNPDGLLAKAKKNMVLQKGQRQVTRRVRLPGATATRANKKVTVSAIVERKIFLGGMTLASGATITLVLPLPSSSKTNGRKSDSSPGMLADVYKMYLTSYRTRERLCPVP